MKIKLQGEELELLAEKAIYWKSIKSLLVTDLHLGKTNHLRKNGIALSIDSQFSTLKKLETIIRKHNIQTLFILGDLFHSVLNNEWREFEHFRLKFSTIEFVLIVGNHDIIEKQHYHSIGVKTFDYYHIGPFILSNEPIKEHSLYNLFGHIHPGIVLKGKARMYNKLPCFYFSETYGILPAFGTLTGLAKIKIEKTARVFGINYPEVIEFTKLTNT